MRRHVRKLRSLTLGAVLVIGGCLAAVPSARAQNPAGGSGAFCAGLWVGEVELTGVSHAEAGAPADLAPAAGTFRFPLIIHLDGSGQARLLGAVALVRLDPTLADPAPAAVRQDSAPATPARTLLLTDPARIAAAAADPAFDARNSYRMSSAAFAMAGRGVDLTPPDPALPHLLHGVIEIAADAPRNPYRHQYHPDHREAWPIRRAIWLSLLRQNPEGSACDDDYRIGYYQEDIDGLHRQQLSAGGTVSLARVSRVDALDE